jgi:PPM family protein phosphatase
MIKLKSFSANSHQGPYLNINEDAYDIDLENNIFMLFDGFGGVGVGDRVVKNVIDSIKTFYSKSSGDPDSTMPFYFSSKYLIEGNLLINAFQLAHKNLYNENSGKDISTRGGASALVASLSENILTLGNVGNIRGYVYRNSRLTKLFEEDSFSSVSGDLFDFQYKTSPLSAFGLFEDLHYLIREFRPMEFDSYLFMTDGVYSRVYNNELESLFEKEHSDSEKISKLFSLANSRGNMDNQSAIILNF